MDFSERQRSALPPAFSACGSYIASCVGFRCVVRDAKTLRVVAVLSFLDRVREFAFSGDGAMIMAVLTDRPVVQVMRVSEAGDAAGGAAGGAPGSAPEGPPGAGRAEAGAEAGAEWSCKINEGAAGLASAFWCPDGEHVITVADFNIRMSVWSLKDRSCVHIKFPKLATRRGFDFSPDGRFMCVAQRKASAPAGRLAGAGAAGSGNCKDCLLVVDTGCWEAVSEFPVATSDLAGLSWSPSGSVVAVWDNCVDYLVLAYSPDGRPLGRYAAYGPTALGVKGVCWSPEGKYLSVGSYDNTMRLLNPDTWDPVAACEHVTPVASPPDVVIYEEVGDAAGGGERYTVAESLPFRVPLTKALPDRANPRTGVRMIEWSPDGGFVATVADDMPGSVWIWSASTLRTVAVLVHGGGAGAAAPKEGGRPARMRVESMRWDPKRLRLAIVCGNDKVYIWTLEGASLIRIPVREIACATGVSWHPSGDVVSIYDRHAQAFCCCYIV